MKVTIEDYEVLKAIQPLQVVSYLQATGWQEESKDNDKSSTWVKRNYSEGELILNLPLKPDIRYFSHRMAEVLKIISDAENRSELDIVNDIRYSWSDVIRFYINNSDVIDGSLLLEDSIRILTSIREMLMWVACSTLHQKSYFPEKLAQAVDYTNRLRTGQTEQGCSYVFTIISPLVLVQNQVENVGLSISSNSFERQVVQRFALALETLHIKAEKKAYQENLRISLIDNMSPISANFCQSVLQMNDFNKNNGLDVRISWSSLLPISDNVLSKINLSANLMPIISNFKEALTDTYS
jgi:hypothetical protein